MLFFKNKNLKNNELENFKDSIRFSNFNFKDSSSFFVLNFPISCISLNKDFYQLNKMYINNSKISLSISNNVKFTIIQALDYLKIKVPRFCYHESLNIAGNCRMCLVELKNSIKPVIACSTLISDNMEIYTDSYMIRNVRKGILEFLLINHPLDCPVCDQAGKCDLQDLAFLFGQDVTRFSIDKRVVSDIFFNKNVKTVMVRCIHCTRCTRFLSDVLVVEGLGMMGRGNGSIISTYIKKNLSNSLVSNVIDLCPVGALISKTNASNYRIWEKESSYFIDFLDPFLKAISIQVCGNRVVDIVPITGSINSFITDRTRYLWKSFQSFRIHQPNTYNKKDFYFTSLFFLINNFFSYFIERNTLFQNTDLLLNFMDLKDTFYISFFFSSLFGLKGAMDLNGLNVRLDNRLFFSDLSNVNSVFLTGVSLNTEFPLMIPVLNRMSNHLNVYLLGSYKNEINNGLSKYKQIGYSINSTRKFLEGRSCVFLYNTVDSRFNKKNDINIFFNKHLFCLFYKINKSVYNFFSINYIRGFSSIHKEEIGSFYNFLGISSYITNKNIFLIKFFTNTEHLKKKYNTVYNFDIHSETNNNISNLKMDVGLYNLFEKTGKFINIKGKIQNVTGRLFNNIDNLLNFEFFIYVLFNYLNSKKKNFGENTDKWLSQHTNFFFSFKDYFLNNISYNFLYGVMVRLFSHTLGYNYNSLFCYFLYCDKTNIIQKSYKENLLFINFSHYRSGITNIVECDVFSKWGVSLENTKENNFFSNFYFY